MFREREVKPDGLDMRLSSEMAAVDQAVAAFRRRYGGRCAEGLFELVLVLRELLTNAVAHGNCLRPDRVVSCRADFLPGGLLRIVVEDQGKGFSREGMDFQLPADPLTDRNRGLALIHAYAESVAFNDKGNRATVHMRCTAAAAQ